MATSNNTIATQTEEEEGDYSHLTAKNINFKCSEGIKARLDKFKVVNNKGFVLRLELGGKLYNGFLIEAIDSFAPVNLTASKRLRPTYYKRYIKPLQPNVTSTKKLNNVYSRANFPRGYVDVFNTIEARLRYGRDKRIRSFNSLHEAGNSSSQTKDDRVFKSNQKNKLKSVVADLYSNDDYMKQTLKSNESDEASETTSNEDSSPPCSLFISESEEISEMSSDTSFCSAVTKIQYSPSKNDEKQTVVNQMCSDKAVQGQLRDLKTGLGRMVSSQKINTDAQSENDYDTLRYD